MHITIEEAVARLQQGGLVAIPTETVYGLAADASNATALQQIYTTKQRPSNNPLIVHIAGVEAVEQWAVSFPPLAQTLAERFWPGPFTLVLKAATHVLPIVTANQPTIALRVPSHPVALAILKQSGLGLAAPSANRYTQVSPTKSTHVMAGLGVHLPVVDGGACEVGLESTIVEVFIDANGQSQWRLLREGMISSEAIAECAGQAQAASEVVVNVPGQHRLHYAPKTQLTVCEHFSEMLAEIEAMRQAGKKIGVLALQVVPTGVQAGLVLSDSPKAYAQQFYDALHQLDAAGVDVILVEKPPQTAQWTAVLDRLQRAIH